MKIKRKPVLIILSCIFLAGNILLGVAVYKSHHKLVESAFWVKHTQQIINQSSSILSTSIDIETAARGYLITKDSIFIKPLLNAEKTIFASIDQLRQLSADNPTQMQRIDSILYFVDKRLDFALQMIKLRSIQESRTSEAYASIMPGYYYSENLRRITNDIQQEENKLLLKRELVNKSSALLFYRFSVVMLLISMLFTILLIIATANYLVQNENREKRQIELLVTNLELSFQIAETGKRASELKIANKELIFQNEEKEKRAAELNIANNELFIQNKEKAKKAADLIIANRELLFQNEEKEKRAVELIIAREKAEESDTLKSAFLNTLSHEVRTPMNQILGFASILKDHQLSDENKGEYLGIITRQCHQLLTVITDIVEISKLTTGQVKLQTDTFNLENTMQIVLESNQTKADIRNLKLHMNKKMTGAGALIQCDEVKLKIILNALIDNAIRFTECGSVTIDYYTANEWLIFEVADTGLGIEESQKQHIFECFRQVEITLSRKYEGLGLGLSIASAYAKMMEGGIRVKSEPGEGSTFFVEIPYIPAIPVLKFPLPALHPHVTLRPDWRTKTLLIAEDDEATMQFYRAVLRPTGIHIFFAENGSEAVKLCKAHPEIELVIMDIKMAVMDGIEATKLIKSFRRNLTIIATTAFAFAGDKKRILDAGCDEYLSKPVTREELLVMIQTCLDKQDKTPTDGYRFSSTELVKLLA